MTAVKLEPFLTETHTEDELRAFQRDLGQRMAFYAANVGFMKPNEPYTNASIDTIGSTTADASAPATGKIWCRTDVFATANALEYVHDPSCETPPIDLGTTIFQSTERYIRPCEHWDETTAGSFVDLTAHDAAAAFSQFTSDLTARISFVLATVCVKYGTSRSRIVVSGSRPATRVLADGSSVDRRVTVIMVASGSCKTDAAVNPKLLLTSVKLSDAATAVNATQ